MTHQPTYQPATTEIFRVDDTAIPKLDPLPRPVNPCKIDIESGLDDAEYDRDKVIVTLFGIANNPIQYVESPIGTKRNKIERIDDGWYGGLAEEQQLWKDAECL